MLRCLDKSEHDRLPFASEGGDGFEIALGNLVQARALLRIQVDCVVAATVQDVLGIACGVDGIEVAMGLRLEDAAEGPLEPRQGSKETTVQEFARHRPVGTGASSEACDYRSAIEDGAVIALDRAFSSYLTSAPSQREVLGGDRGLVEGARHHTVDGAQDTA